MTRAQLARVLRQAILDAVANGDLAVAVPDAVAVTPPGPGGLGDWSTPVALQLAARTGVPAPRIARLLADRVGRAPGVARVEVSGDGFVNVTMDEDPAPAIIEAVLTAGAAYCLGEEPAGGASGATTVLGPPPHWRMAASQLPRTLDNPVFTVLLARARVATLDARSSLAGPPTGQREDPPGAARSGPAPRALVLLLEDYPGCVRRATDADDPGQLARHLERLATATLDWVDDRADPPALTDADARLAAAARTVLTNGLRLLGVTVPVRV